MIEKKGSDGAASTTAPVTRTGGVADYFAILGVGENLVWKHTQKKNGAETSSTGTEDTPNADLQEDEAALMERFYREIVDVAIITTTPDGQENTETLVTHNPPITNRNVNLARTFTDDTSQSSDTRRIASTPSPQILPSPTDSDATTVVTMPDGATVKTTVTKVEVEGFKVLSVTCPAGRGSDTDPTAVLSVSTTGYASVNDSVMSANSATDLDARSTPIMGEIWSKLQVFDANLDPVSGLRGELVAGGSISPEVQSKRKQHGDNARLRGLGRKMGSTLRTYLLEDRFKDRQTLDRRKSTKFHIGYRRRNPEETDRPAIADLSLRYVRIHRSTVCGSFSAATTTACDDVESSAVLLAAKKKASPLKRGLATSASIAAKVAEAGKHKLLEKYREAKEKGDSDTGSRSSPRHFFPEEEAALAAVQHAAGAEALFVPLEEFLSLPNGFTEWSIPSEYELLRFPHPDRLNSPSLSRKTFLVPHGDDSSGAGVEAFVDGNSFLNASSTSSHRNGKDSQMPSIFVPDGDENDLAALDPEVYLPQMLPERLPESNEMDIEEGYIYVPIIAVRRQRVGDEERYKEDPGIVDLVVSFCDHGGKAVMPDDTVDMDDDADDEDDEAFSLLGKTSWSRTGQPSSQEPQLPMNVQRPLPVQTLGTPVLLVRRNMPNGFADAPFATRVLDRFPLKNYKDRPMPEEELPMFCYPTGCRLHRAQFSDCPLAQYYGFVVKNERGDSIHVSCVSFMEPLTTYKTDQLTKISQRRCRTSIPHRRFCEKRARKAARQRRLQGGITPTGSNVSDLRTHEEAGAAIEIHSEGSDVVDKALSDASFTDDDDSMGENMLLTGFDDMTTFENKTICLISRYPFWTAFRRFLSHLHILSGSSSDLPLERWISHLLLTVPVPKPGGPCVLVPLPTLNGPCGGPMVLELPPSKDLPLTDLPFHRLLACLDVPTIVTVVLGFLALERKVIIISTRSSLVLDGCELLRSLLFPFDLCAPYVPRLTEPFMSCLDFPGAIFVGIHDDGLEGGLASTVRKDLPEDSAIIDLDTGEIDCSGDRYEVLKQCWGIIPASPRSQLVSEIETLCRDAGIVPGQEPLDSQIDSAFDAPIPSHIVEDFDQRGDTEREPFDDRAMRDSFLRFFCSVLGGYERYLVVPDVDFLISGNEWFDSQGFLSSAPQDRAPFLGSLVTTQLFQSFIQRRTEASDVHCLLFDECLAEYYKATVPYGRLGGDVETNTSSEEGQPKMLYSLLVDQCAAEPYQHIVAGTEDSERSRDGIASDTDSSSIFLTKDTQDLIQKTDSFKGDTSIGTFPSENEDFVVNNIGDIVTVPSRKNLVDGSRFVYCVDGNPCFPQHLASDLFFPLEPESLLVELSETHEPLLSRSDREVEDSNRRRKMATSYRGLNNQRRCMWQLPKLMGSHFLGSWLMCIPSQVSQPYLSQEQQSRYLLRGLGALRTLRNRQRIVPDEAAYRALMVACGRAGSDRRVELVKLFGLLRSDGIFPSAVTLGQYTRAIAEGFSKRSTGKPDDVHTGVGSVIEGKEVGDIESVLNSLDGNLEILEDSGQRWRQRESHTPSNDKHKKRAHQRFWVPVTFSSSFVPTLKTTEIGKVRESIACSDDMRFIALWSRTSSCDSCFYIPLEEEVQSGWDVVGGEPDVPGCVSCPRCGSLLVPKIGYRVLSFSEALQIKASKGETTNMASGRQSIAEASLRNKLATHRSTSKGSTGDSFDSVSSATPKKDSKSAEDGKIGVQQGSSWPTRANKTNADFGSLPNQIKPSIDDKDVDSIDKVDSSVAGYVTYVSPAAMRASLERLVNERGEAALERETMRKLDPELFYNFLWYCTRFSLPLPLPINITPGSPQSERPKHYCAFASWDRSVAERGCHTAARTLLPLVEPTNSPHGEADVIQGADSRERTLSVDLLNDFPLLSRFNLQALSQGDWDHPDLSAILVALVEACDKRDFRPVIECVLRCNTQRRERFGSLVPARQNSVDSGSDVHISSDQHPINFVELDCYRTCLYLAKYQCTTAFHAFFPAVAKPCKGYHFWCPTVPLPIFDRLFRDAVKRIRSKDNSFTPLHDVSDVALGFRCVFGHLI